MLDIVMCCLSRELCWSSELIIDILEKHIVVIYTENPPVKTSTDCIREELWRRKENEFLDLGSGSARHNVCSSSCRWNIERCVENIQLLMDS